ncbi:hypothetical protein L7F22_000601 [Adiantum nelumboides]|nr:hypothetical protein [Adiantum nelumboides]
MQGKSKQSIEDGMNRTSDAADQATLNLFAVAYHMGKNDLSFNKHASMLSLLRFCKCPFMTTDLYHNDKACATFIYYISESLLQDIVRDIQASDFFSLMMDESTDIGQVQHMIVVVNFMKDLEPVTAFLGLLEIQKGTSSHLYDSCKFFMTQLGLDSTKMACLGTDGASSMIGRKNGLGVRLQRDSPYMTRVHCIAHRASLCLANAVKDSPYAQEIDHLINDIAATFSRSAQRSHQLKDLETESPKLKEFQLIYSIHFMADILDRLAILSKTFQSSFVDIASVVGIVEAEIRFIRMHFIEDPHVELNSLIYDSRGYHIIPDYGPLGGQLAGLRASIHGNTFRSVDVERMVDGSDLEKAIVFQKEFCNLVIDNLLERFPDKDLVGCFKALAPCSFPKGKQLKNYGVAEIESLASYYGSAKFLKNKEQVGPWVDMVQVKKEYQYFKLQAPFEWEDRSLRDTWVSIARNPTTRAKYPMLLILAHLSMLQCASTASCKRGFSIQNIIKSKLRKALTTRSMDALMQISMEGPNVEDFDFSKSIDMWRNTAKTSHHIYGEHTRVHGIQRSTCE